jgi:UDP-N-acetylmuramoyl-tripeptide--D-alanyl-D-alanine ligase
VKFTIDSRNVEAGDIFIPIKGKNHDGHDFIADVLQKGGKVLDRPLIDVAADHRSKFDLSIIAISGSSGKTTLKDMLAHILSTKYKVVKNEGNYNNEIGVPLTLLKLQEDTEIAVMEIGARHQGDIAELVKLIKPTDVCLTNIGVAHLEIFGSRENIAEAKSEIIYPGSKFYLNANIDFKELLINKAKQNNCQIIEYSSQDMLEQNLSAALKIVESFDISSEQARKALKTFSTSTHRLKVISNADSSFNLIDDCYNSNPDSLRYLIYYCNNHFPTAKKLYILGDMLELGHESPQMHRMIEIPKDDILLTLGKDSAQIQGAKIHQHYQEKTALINDLPQFIESVDLIAVKGSRGIEMETIVEFINERIDNGR